MSEDKKFVALNMCDFCSNEIESCGAAPVYGKEINLKNGQLNSEETIVACDKYSSPVDVLKKQFH